MYDLAQVIDVTLSFFYEDMPEGVAGNRNPFAWRELALLPPA